MSEKEKNRKINIPFGVPFSVSSSPPFSLIMQLTSRSLHTHTYIHTYIHSYIHTHRRSTTILHQLISAVKGRTWFILLPEWDLAPAILCPHGVAYTVNRGIKWNVRVACLKISRRINEISGPWLSAGTCCCMGCCCWVCKDSAFRTRST